MTKRIWFYPAAAIALATGLMASTAQASPTASPLSALRTGISEQGNLAEKTHYQNWRRHYWHGYRHHHYRHHHYRHHQYWNHHYRHHHYRQHYYRPYQYRYRGW